MAAPQFGGEQRAVIGAELVGMQAKAEAERLRGAHYGARFVQGKDVRFAEDVAVFGEVVADNQRQHLVDHEIDVVVDAAAILVGDFVSAQEGGDAAHARDGGELADGPENLKLGFQRQAVSRLGFDGGGASAEEPVRVAVGGGEQVVVGGLAGEADGGADASAGCRDFGVGGAFHAAFKLGCAVAGENRMGVSIDKTGKYDAAAGVDDFGFRGERALDLLARAQRRRCTRRVRGGHRRR